MRADELAWSAQKQWLRRRIGLTLESGQLFMVAKGATLLPVRTRAGKTTVSLKLTVLDGQLIELVTGGESWRLLRGTEWDVTRDGQEGAASRLDDALVCFSEKTARS